MKRPKPKPSFGLPVRKDPTKLAEPFPVSAGITKPTDEEEPVVVVAPREVERNAITLVNVYRQECVGRNNVWPPNANPGSWPSWDHKLPPASTSLWLSLARSLAARGIEPDLYIRRMFHATPINVVPSAVDLASPATLETYARATHNMRGSIIIRGKCEGQTCISEVRCMIRSVYMPVTLDQAHLSVLWGDKLSPLFRYCLAWKLEEQATGRQCQLLGEVRHNNWADAAIQYIRAWDLYNELWASLLPEGFGDRAIASYRKGIGMVVDRK